MHEANVEGMAAVFLVSDVRRSAEYYRDSLGFSFERYWGGDPPSFCIVRRGVSGVMLVRHAHGDGKADVNTNGEATGHGDDWDAYIWVSDADALAAEVKANGAVVSRDLDNTFYDMREFVVKDPDGYHICFGSPIERERA